MKIEEIAALSDEELRVMCAEGDGYVILHGWVCRHGLRLYNVGTLHDTWAKVRRFLSLDSICPNYPASIDAIHAAVNARDRDFREHFCDELTALASNEGNYITSLTARDWAVCFAYCAQTGGAR